MCYNGLILSRDCLEHLLPHPRQHQPQTEPCLGPGAGHRAGRQHRCPLGWAGSVPWLTLGPCSRDEVVCRGLRSSFQTEPQRAGRCGRGSHQPCSLLPTAAGKERSCSGTHGINTSLGNMSPPGAPASYTPTAGQPILPGMGEKPKTLGVRRWASLPHGHILGFQASVVVIFSKRGKSRVWGAAPTRSGSRVRKQWGPQGVWKGSGSTAALCRTLLPPIPTALLPGVHDWLLAPVPGRSNLQFL